MIISDIIHFEPLDANAPTFPCNLCGRPASEDGRMMAVIHPFVDESVDVSFVVCGAEHAETFLKNPNINIYIMEMVMRVQKYAQADLTEEYLDYMDEAFNKITQQ